jgi:hypothetical protein
VIGRAASGVWCDYCKAAWGQINNQWHEKAKTPAWVSITSTSLRSKGIIRSYCWDHALYLTEGLGNETFSFDDQVKAGNEYLTRRLTKEAVANV